MKDDRETIGFPVLDDRHLSRSVKRVTSAIGEGSMAISFVHQHLAHG